MWAVGDGVILEFDRETWMSLEGPPQAEALYTRGGGEAWVTAPDGVWQYVGIRSGGGEQRVAAQVDRQVRRPWTGLT